ncbi:hypothetical protein QLQ12_05650 [Actinoplanes sp. NEAU-A12]|uniref:Uncharacterized protein n=1 Tax=Actinoplanes sandaracinus TaxID=3045177 RepID=A0ABT6WED6_9ACTN|nr:hypothetical protein [Actinoplanes sandaracinus]MDI6098086.1 hypothetical protein [Actinoplanes sandaracinus]
MDRTTAESLLRGGHPLPAGHPLGGLLAAAQAPATERELAGEAAALAAFRAAAHSPARPRRSRWAAHLGKLLSLKVAAAAIATVGGVALAANNGSLPSVGGEADSVVPASTAPQPVQPLPDQPRPERPRPSAAATTTAPAPPPVQQLCREFSGHAGDDRERALHDDYFGELVRRAGKRDGARVERFCQGLPRPSRGSQPTWPGATSQPPRPGPDGTPGRRGGGHDRDFDHDSGGTRPDRPRPSASNGLTRR